jgi:hypothetical protein
VRDAIGRRVPWGSSANLGRPRDAVIGQLGTHTQKVRSTSCPVVRFAMISRTRAATGSASIMSSIAALRFA